jgi:hypothetical protein
MHHRAEEVSCMAERYPTPQDDDSLERSPDEAQRVRSGSSDEPQRARPRSGGEADPDAIARRAYDRFTARGGEHGRDQEDWFDAERELKS